MISEIRRLSLPPSSNIKYPVYVRTSNNRFFIKIKSETEAVWIEHYTSEKSNAKTTGYVACHDGEFFDIEFIIKFCHKSSEKEYIEKLKELIDHYESVKASLNL